MSQASNVHKIPVRSFEGRDKVKHCRDCLHCKPARWRWAMLLYPLLGLGNKSFAMEFAKCTHPDSIEEWDLGGGSGRVRYDLGQGPGNAAKRPPFCEHERSPHLGKCGPEAKRFVGIRRGIFNRIEEV